MSTLRILGLGCLLTLSVAGLAQAAESVPPDFLDGDYVLVGREPAGGATYAGRARIESKGAKLTLHRRLDGGPSEVLAGAFESAAGGDARVVRFRGPAARARTLTCLVAGDLDNYGRLSCVWTYDADPAPKEPGLETFFATAAWPDGSVHKRFDSESKHR